MNIDICYLYGIYSLLGSNLRLVDVHAPIFIYIKYEVRHIHIFRTDESIDSVHNAIYFTPADQTYFGKLYSSMRSRLLREPVPATPTLTREQAQSIVHSLLTPQPDLNTIKDLSFSDFVPYL